MPVCLPRGQNLHWGCRDTNQHSKCLGSANCTKSWAHEEKPGLAPVQTPETLAIPFVPVTSYNDPLKSFCFLTHYTKLTKPNPLKRSIHCHVSTSSFSYFQVHTYMYMCVHWTFAGCTHARARARGGCLLSSCSIIPGAILLSLPHMKLGSQAHVLPE